MLVDGHPVALPEGGAAPLREQRLPRPLDPPVAHKRRLAAMSALLEHSRQRRLDGLLDRHRPDLRRLPRHGRDDAVTQTEQRAMTRFLLLTMPAGKHAHRGHCSG